jgi:phage terminase large subunit GpA-like protein
MRTTPASTAAKSPRPQAAAHGDAATGTRSAGRWATPSPIASRPRATAFTCGPIHSANETFGTIAEDYLRHLKRGLKVDFYGNRLAIAYESETRVPGWVELGKRAAWTHARRTVSDEVWFLTAGIDKQGENNGARYVIRGWAPGRTSWLIDWGWIARDEADTGPILSDLMETRASRAWSPISSRQSRQRAVDQSARPPALARAPLGHRHEPLADADPPLDAAASRGVGRPHERRPLVPGRIRNIRGDHTVRPDVRFRHNLVESNARTGEKYEGGLHLWGIYVYPFYSELTDLISGEPGQVGSWYVTSDCLTQGREYLEQVTNFGYSITLDARKGKKGKWGPRNGRIPVDFWDCEIYAMAMAEMVVGDMGWEAAAWEQWRRTTLPKRIKRTNHAGRLDAAPRITTRLEHDSYGRQSTQRSTEKQRRQRR